MPMMRCPIGNKASWIGARPDWADRVPVLMPRADIIFLLWHALQGQPSRSRNGSATPCNGLARPSVFGGGCCLVVVGCRKEQVETERGSVRHKNWTLRPSSRSSNCPGVRFLVAGLFFPS